MRHIETALGYHISTACDKAVEMATEEHDSVSFEFNGIAVVAAPGEDPREVESRWNKDFNADFQARINSSEYKESERKRAEELQRKTTAHMIEPAQTEAEMRETDDKWPYTPAQLLEYIDSLTNRSHDYGTCVYALSLAAVAAFNYVAHQLGVTGFQSSCADLDIVRRTRHIKGPFMLLTAEKALYPQHGIQEDVYKALVEWEPWLREQAEKELKESPGAHPDVLAHWHKLAGH